MTFMNNSSPDLIPELCNRENLFDVFELARSREFLDNGVIGIVIMGESRVVFACVVENLKGEVEILLASDH